MQVSVLQVAVENRGKYNMATVDYKGQDGKPAQKKLMSFTNPDVYKVFSNAKLGDVFEVTTVKNDKGYWDWTEVKTGDATAAAQSGGGKSFASPKSTYETPEERAIRQVMIVRQSSLGHALTMLGGKATVGKAIEVAQQFEAFVLGKTDTPKEQEFNMDDLESDVV